MDHRFGKSRRLRSGRQFAAVIHQGSVAANGVLVLYAKPAPNPRSRRLGITVPRRAGTAVVRNRWKRHIREAFRTQREQLPAGYDYVARPKKGAAPDAAAVAASLLGLAQQAARRQVGKRRPR